MMTKLYSPAILVTLSKDNGMLLAFFLEKQTVDLY